MSLQLLEEGGRHNHGKRYNINYIRCGINEDDAITCIIPWEKIKDYKEGKGKTLDLMKGETPKYAQLYYFPLQYWIN